MKRMTKDQVKILKIFFVIVVALNSILTCILPNIFVHVDYNKKSVYYMRFLAMGDVLPLILIIVFYVAAIVFILNYKEKIAMVFTTLSMIVFIAFIFIETHPQWKSSGWDEKPSSGSTIIIVIGIIAIVLNLLCTWNAYPKEPKAVVIVDSSDGKSKIEEISLLKKLLDEGAITNEEFETKKKELLNL